jgi:hypothetical protein
VRIRMHSSGGMFLALNKAVVGFHGWEGCLASTTYGPMLTAGIRELPRLEPEDSCLTLGSVATNIGVR